MWLIGQGGELQGSQEEGFKLIMDNGKGDHCPNGRKRKTIVSVAFSILGRLVVAVSFYNSQNVAVK